MALNEEQSRIKSLLTETIVLLCKNGLNYRKEFSVDALIGITLDRNNVILININESILNQDIPLNNLSKSNDNYSNKDGSQCQSNYDVVVNENELSDHIIIEFDDNVVLQNKIEVNSNKSYNSENNNFSRSKNYLTSSSSSETVKIFQSTDLTTPQSNELINLNLSIITEKENSVICKSEPSDDHDIDQKSCSIVYDSLDLDSLTDSMNWQVVHEDLSDLNLWTENYKKNHFDNNNSITKNRKLYPQLLQQQKERSLSRNYSAHNSHQNNCSFEISNKSSQQFTNEPDFSNSLTIPKCRYHCSICFKEMRLLRDLKAHLATKHNLGKSFACSVCHTGFTYKHNLLVHLRTVHSLTKR